MFSIRQISLLFSIGVFSLGCGRSSLRQSRPFQLEPGDLLFQDLDCGEMCDAIEKVTTGYKSANFSHVGIASKNADGAIVVIEAVSTGVKVTDLQAFLNRSSDDAGKPKVVVGRLKKRYRNLIAPAIEASLALKGKPYDKVFAIDNDAYYCSELVYEAFSKANGGNPVFKLKPMTFNDPDTEELFSVWKDYYADLNAPVPQGRPGLNPGGISRSAALNIVHRYGRVSRGG